MIGGGLAVIEGGSDRDRGGLAVIGVFLTPHMDQEEFPEGVKYLSRGESLLWKLDFSFPLGDLRDQEVVQIRVHLRFPRHLYQNHAESFSHERELL